MLARRRPSFGRLAERLPRVDQKTGLIAVAASPTGKVLMLAGAAGLRPRLVALADAGGTLVQLTALYVVGRPLVRAVDWSPRVTALLGGAIVILTLAAGVVATRSPAAAVDRLALESGEG